ncbi:MAG: cytochrome c biogenesis protein [candidate division Zixibacteria bacterium]|nr:cytochrome c biogenesis protein [candidate division Zixibacteria bacterium]
MWWKLILFPLMLITIFAIFYFPAPQSQLGDISRIIYFHVPVAWVAVFAFLVSMVNSIGYLRKRNLLYDTQAVISARLGLVFCLLATISGAIFAIAAWGSFWNWDPRETTIFVLLLIYGAYFALRSAATPEHRKASLSGVYSVIAFLTVPFLIFVIPRVYESLHPNTSIINQKLKFQMPLEILILFILCLVNMMLVFLWMYNLEIRVSKLNELKRKGEDAG